MGRGTPRSGCSYSFESNSHCKRREMPRSRASEMPQRPYPRAPHSLRTSSSSDSDPVHPRSRTTVRSPRLSEPLNQRKLGSRIADLETQLGQAQGELKCLKDQLASAEAAKTAAQELLNKKSRKPKKVVEMEDKKESNEEFYDDVFEVPMEKAAVESKESLRDETRALKEKSREAEVVGEENAKMKMEIEELSLKLKQVNEEVEKSRANVASMKEKVEASERGKVELEMEMKRLRVQTEQWRKAADAAAAVLAGEVDKQVYGSSPEDSDDGGKRRGSGIKMFGDLWRKKGNK
ncbi:interactor of constitutive active ROPs 1-like isoform X1 [Salvia splendens]|uniref:interactor of constitutive active ROPs 1-like isoform X1 n=1 Tax=Salvia splendens TaxID=180675 RepID=UPI001C274E93|nr:interactor of constitutive active ROPs 1-like isoform X1 [Salvia splendens]